MAVEYSFEFNSDISNIPIPEKLNNPFGKGIPDIALIATKEFQAYITKAAADWDYNFRKLKGKMFGILVVQKEDLTYRYLGTNSGILSRNTKDSKLIPSIFDDTTVGHFMKTGMTELTELSNKINKSTSQAEITKLSEYRKQKSIDLQQQLFQNYHILNALGDERNVLEIFELYSQNSPPSAAGECAAPKLLHYAFRHQLKPIAIAEFWWGNPTKNKDRRHKQYYPACKNKCQPILEYMLDDHTLYKRANAQSSNSNNQSTTQQANTNKLLD